MYTDRNFKTKKQLKEAVQAYLDGKGPAVTYFQPGPFGGREPAHGTFCVEGPHYPEPHRWYATCEASANVIIKVR